MLFNKNFLYFFLVYFWKPEILAFDIRFVEQFKDFLPVKPLAFRQAENLLLNALENQNGLLEFLHYLKGFFLPYSRDPSGIIIRTDENPQTDKLVKVYLQKV